MANKNWKIWAIPFGVWALYLSWYSGYQSGYSDGHETAWTMSRPNLLALTSDEMGDSGGDSVTNSPGDSDR